MIPGTAPGNRGSRVSNAWSLETLFDGQPEQREMQSHGEVNMSHDQAVVRVGELQKIHEPAMYGATHFARSLAPWPVSFGAWHRPEGYRTDTAKHAKVSQFKQLSPAPCAS